MLSVFTAIGVMVLEVLRGCCVISVLGERDGSPTVLYMARGSIARITDAWGVIMVTLLFGAKDFSPFSWRDASEEALTFCIAEV